MAKNENFYEYTGVVKKVGDLQEFSHGFCLRELVLGNDVGVEENPKYPVNNPFTFKKDNAKKIDGVRKGMRVKVTFCLDGREYNGRIYAGVTGFKCEVLDANAAAVPDAPEPPESVTEFDDDEMPF